MKIDKIVVEKMIKQLSHMFEHMPLWTPRTMKVNACVFGRLLTVASLYFKEHPEDAI